MSTATEVKLLTLLNVSAIKRPRDLDQPGGYRSPTMSRAQSTADDTDPAAVAASVSTNSATAPNGAVKRRKRSVVFGGEVGPSGSTYGVSETGPKGKGKGKGKARAEGGDGDVIGVIDGGHAAEIVDDEEDEDEDKTADDTFNSHFGVNPAALTADAITADSAGAWVPHRTTVRGLGRAIELLPGSTAEAGSSEFRARIIPSISAALKTAPALTHTYLSHLGLYKDLYAHSLDGEADGSESKLFGDDKEALRSAASAHAVNHVLKTRRKIIRNNERLAHAAAATAVTVDAIPEPPRDQSFTRPKALFLFPLRSLALHYLTTHIFPLAPAGTQIENLRPFTSSFSIPEDGDDPLTSKSAIKDFPTDHLVNFRGNSDDNFRIGIKITRKAWRVVMMPANETKLLECDILIASPLGIKMAAERENSTDLLSSIEVAIVDGVDVMQMQNWDHVQFVFNHLNEIPKSPHGCDFSRVKPWYLEGHARLLRQTLVLSRYDSPEARALVNRQCHNVAGKIRLDRAVELAGVLGRVRPGVRQIFDRIDTDGSTGTGTTGAAAMSSEAAVEEVDARLDWFTKKTIPALLRSAVSRQNTLVIVPSYFDFVRVTNYLRKSDVVSYAAISEYSSNSEISRARTLFFKGKRALLVVTERFHFYRRYRLRGAKTIVFYSLPDHAQFYAELLATPFIPSKEAEQAGMDHDVDEAEISSRVLFSRFDVLKLERVVGHADARRMLASAEARFEFI